MNIIFKRFLAFALSFVIIFSSVSSANAATSVGGWSATDSIIAGANTTINATKNAASGAVKSAVTVGASASKVGKHLIKGGGQAALLYAMIELAGEGVEWLLDPANNAVKYKVDAAAGNGYDPLYRYILTRDSPVVYYATVADACRGLLPLLGDYQHKGCKLVGTTIRTTTNPNEGYKVDAPTNGTAPPMTEWKSIPINSVAEKVIVNAVAGHAPSQEAVKATALEGFTAGEHDAALDAAAVPDTGVDNPPDVDNPPLDPAIPFDPSSIIAAIKSVMAAIVNMAGMVGSKFDELIANDNVNAKAEADVAAQEKIDRDAKAKADADFVDWVKEEPSKDEEDTTLAIPDNTVLPADTDINFGGSCPANFEVNSSIFGNPINIVLLDTAKFCGFLSTFVKYPVYAVSSLFALYILGGRKDV